MLINNTEDDIPGDSLLRVLQLHRVDVEQAKPESIWREDPTDLHTFITHKDYCNLPSLTPEQYISAIAILGEDPKLIFDLQEGTGKTIAVLLWGKGSGKDYLTSIIHLYCVHVVLCLKEPQLYFFQAPGEPLDIVNVAYNADQAEKVYFTKFIARLTRCGWFQRRFDFIKSGKLLSKRKSTTWGEVNVGATLVTFPGNIRAISESSQNESYEGYNIIVWIMDEASAFKSAKRIENARAIYNTLKSSANTRFVGRWKGFVLSYPRAEDDWDFTTQLYKESLTSSDMYGSRKFSWEVAPTTAYPGPKFRFIYERSNQRIEIMVPEVLRDEFVKYPDESLGKYCCMPARSQGAFFELAGAIPRVLSNRPPIFETEIVEVESRNDFGEVIFRGVGHNITKWNLSSVDASKYKFVAHVDVGLTNDSAAMSIGHLESILVDNIDKETQDVIRGWIQRVVEDVHVIWEPDPKRNLRVSVRNIETVLTEVKKFIPLEVVTYDHWNSAGSVETLAMHGITAKEHNIDRDDYVLLRSSIYAGDVDLLADPLTEFELTQLRKTITGSVDHPEGGSKDLADALAGVVALLLKDKKALDDNARKQNVGVPRATVGYNHSGVEEGNTFFAGSNVSRGSGSAPVRRVPGRAPEPGLFSGPMDIPPMPFGIGDGNRARPMPRLLSDKVSQMPKGNSAIDNRMRSLARGK